MVLQKDLEKWLNSELSIYYISSFRKLFFHQVYSDSRAIQPKQTILVWGQSIIANCRTVHTLHFHTCEPRNKVHQHDIEISSFKKISSSSSLPHHTWICLQFPKGKHQENENTYYSRGGRSHSWHLQGGMAPAPRSWGREQLTKPGSFHTNQLIFWVREGWFWASCSLDKTSVNNKQNPWKLISFLPISSAEYEQCFYLSQFVWDSPGG